MDPDKNHLTAAEVESYRKRSMAETARRRVDRHLADCEICLDLILDADGPGLALARLSEAFLTSSDETPFHMSAQNLANYAEGRLGEADRVSFESHLEICSECKAASEALSDTSTIREVRPAARLRTESKRREFRRWSWPALPVRGYLAGIAALLVCLFLIWAIWLRGSETKPRQQANTGDQATPAPDEDKNPKEALDGEPGTNPPDAGSAAGSSKASLKDGLGSVGLDQHGNLFGLTGLAPSDEEAVRGVLASGRLARPRVLKELSGPPIKLMDRSTNGWPFKLIDPIHTAVIDEHPVLKWNVLPGAVSYTVSVFDDKFNRVANSKPQPGPRWRVPIRLSRGQVYSWEVTALKDDQEIKAPVAPAPRARFKVLRRAESKELNEVRNRQPGSHLALGILCARLGLLNEAETEFRALVRANPDSPLAKTLLADVRSWRFH